MCLDHILDGADRMPASAIAFKIVWETPTGYAPLYAYDELDSKGFGWDGRGWAIPDDAAPIETRDGDGGKRSYLPGVHAYIRPVSAIKEYLYVKNLAALFGNRSRPVAIVRVLLRGPICAGVQDGELVVVYREMTILGRYMAEDDKIVPAYSPNPTLLGGSGLCA